MKMHRIVLAVALLGLPIAGFGQAQTAGTPAAPAPVPGQHQGMPDLAEQLSGLGKGLEALSLAPELEKSPEAKTETKALHLDVVNLQQNLAKQTNEQVRVSLEGVQKRLEGLGPKIAGDTNKKVAEMVTSLNGRINTMVTGILASTGKFVEQTVDKAMQTSQQALDAGLKQGLDAADAAMKQAQETTDAALKDAQDQADAAMKEAMQGIGDPLPGMGTSTGE